jgi:hypothetical protein
LIVLFLGTFFSNCQREIKEIKNPVSENLPQSVSDFIKEHSGEVVIPSHELVTYRYVDANENLLSSHGNARITSSNPDWCDDPFGDDVPIPDPSEVTQTAYKVDCANGGYIVTVTWRVKTPFEIVAENPFSPSTKSTGKIRIKDIGNNTLYQNNSIAINSSDIVYISQDPNDNDVRMYDVTYTTPVISWTVFQTISTVAYAFNIWTDCTSDNFPSGFAINTPFTSPISYPDYTNSTQPCDRLDFAAIDPSSPPTGYVAYAIGTDPLGSGCYPTGWVYNTGTQFQYRKSGTSTWHNLEIYFPTSGLRTNGYVYFWEVMYIPDNGTNSSTNFFDGSGTYEFRWRNIMKSDAVSSPNSTNVDCASGIWSSITTLTI